MSDNKLVYLKEVETIINTVLHPDNAKELVGYIDQLTTFNSPTSPPDSDGWVSVKDELPKPQERVLVFVSSLEGPIKIDYIRVCDSYGNPVNWFRYAGITHWRPLPVPPK